ncbi:MAG: DNA methyltransferase [Clostridiales bacterium]|jgi:site-specific DNA-methyltransferase (adenine-specific)|nr:DNA methyltransferase [Clostridiales bacterium]
MENTLYYGDNLDILKRYIPDESVDLVYLDPPFKSDQNYNILFKEQNGSRAASQIRAFEDTWIWTQESEEIYADLVTRGDKVADCLKAFRTFLGTCDMLAYLVMMAPRLVELRRVMKPTASIYLHCDPTASHYLKMLMDAIFGGHNFRREVIWRSGWVSGFKSAAKNWIRNHDVILYYLRDSRETFTFHIPFKPHPPGYKRRGGEGENPAGVPIDDVWIDIYSPAIMSFSREKLGYPTQKPLALLERIIKASSNEGDLVLDPFCGCGTTVIAAQKLNRSWIGIDITHLAINLMKYRLIDTFGDQVKFKIIGEPASLPDARALAQSDPYQFQFWALGLIGARPVEQKKGADRGIDGKIVFQADKPGEFKEVLIQVKAGHTSVAHVRDLRGVVENENAAIGVLISMKNPTKPMRTVAASAGFYESKIWGKKYPKIQLLTIEELLNGKKIEMPPIRQAGATFKRAIRHKAEQGEQLEISLSEEENK